MRRRGKANEAVQLPTDAELEILNVLWTTGQPLVHALGWTLLHFCWQGAVVAGLLWCVLALIGGRATQTRYGLACAALLLMAALPLATFARLAAAESRGAGRVKLPAFTL